MDMGVLVVPEEGAWAVHLRGNVLSPLTLAVANHIADVLRLKLAIDAGALPLAEVALSQPLEQFTEMIEDLRGEDMEGVMEAMAAAAAADEGEGDGEEQEGAHEEVEQPLPAGAGGQQQVVGAGASAAEEGEGSGATDGGSVAGGVPRAQQARQAQQAQHGARQDAASDQTGVPLELSSEPQAAAVGQAEGPEAARQAQQRQQAEGQGEQRQQGSQGAASTAAGAATARQPGSKQQQEQQRKQLGSVQVGEPAEGGGAAKVVSDEELARKLQQQYLAQDRYADRKRRSAAPAQGSLQMPGGRGWDAWHQRNQEAAQEAPAGAPAASGSSLQGQGQGLLGSGAASRAATGTAVDNRGIPEHGEHGEEDGEGEEEEEEEGEGERVEFRGVAARGRGEGRLRWQAVFAATLNQQEVPALEGRKHHSLVACECGSQAEAAVARDLALLWRETRLGFPKGILTWQPEEYNFEASKSYQARTDLNIALHSCRSLPDLRDVLEGLRQAGTLAELAGSAQRNPLSLAVRHDMVEPCTEAAQAVARQRYHGVLGSGDARSPWRATAQMHSQAQQGQQGQQGQKPKKGGGASAGAGRLNAAVFGSYPTSAQAAAAADLAVAWREQRQVKDGDVEGQQYNFPLQGYREDELVWGLAMLADNEQDVRILLRKLRDCGRMEVIVQRAQQLAAEQQGQQGQKQQQQGEKPGQAAGGGAAAAAAAAGGPAAATPAGGQGGGKKRGRGGAKPAATAAVGSGGGGGGGGGVKRRKAPSAPAASPGAAAAAAATAAEAGDGAVGEEGLDPFPLAAACTEAAANPAAQKAGLSLPLLAQYMIALESKSRQNQKSEIALLHMWLGQQQWEGVSALMTAAVKAAGLAAD